MFKIFITTLGIIFMAELGDKTQLATMLLAAESKSWLAVFLGAVTALCLSTLIGVFSGSILSKTIPTTYLQTGAGLAFIIIGFLLLFNKI
ncbi:MAG: TMEM165/GDT1 family protein [Clostridia bacterium]|nr:TMEM165/GDT1 family protein [Clostridia bacterium]